MNKRLTVKTELGDLRYCVLSAEKDYEKQLEELLGVTAGAGFSVKLCDDAVKLVDYFHGETRASFEIISFEDSEEDVSLSWTLLDCN